MKWSLGTWLGVVFVAILAVLLFTNQQNESELIEETPGQPPSNGVITVTDKYYDFGTISMRDGDVTHTYELQNNSDEEVVLGELYTSCMCTTARVKYSDGNVSKLGGMRGHGAPTYLNRAIQPGESFQVEVIYNPAAHGPAGTGPVNRTVYIETNSTRMPVIELNLSAMVTR